MHTNVSSAVVTFRSFIDFCRSCGVRKVFFEGGSDEEIRLRAWLNVADSTYHTELIASAG